jgi:uncharacterized membrane protein
MTPPPILDHSTEIVATALFALAILHTFLTKYFHNLAHRFEKDSIGEGVCHLLGEIEIVFGFWGGVFVTYLAIIVGSENAIHYLESLNFREAAFVFVIMSIAATRPILVAAEKIISWISLNFLWKPENPVRNITYFITIFTFGPLLGSFVTEPAAMTVVAILLKSQFFDAKVSKRFMYSCIAVLFVNISIGGTLTNYAAPPILMVANVWHWDNAFMMTHFGYKTIIAVFLNTFLLTAINYRELIKLKRPSIRQAQKMPLGIKAIYLLFLILVVATAHHMTIFAGIFLFFLGVTAITKKYQDELQLRSSLLVAFFLAGLVVLGNLQAWWLKPIIASLSDMNLFFSATALTAVTDNAALTYLGSLVPEMSDSMHYALVAGAVAGGGLTIIANAPNPAGYSILRDSFGEDGIDPIQLLLYALIPTVVAMLCFWNL